MYLQSKSPHIQSLRKEEMHINHMKLCGTKLQLKPFICGYIPPFPLHAKTQLYPSYCYLLQTVCGFHY